MLRVFLSSTGRDLHECRRLAYQAIEGLDGYHCIRMEDFGAWDETPAELCHRRVSECDLFVIVAGPLYGSMGPDGLSYTESEYDVAQVTGKPCFVFLTTEDFLIPANIAESLISQRKQEAFRKKISQRVRAAFSTCAELPLKVIQAIRNWEASPSEHSIIRIQRVGDAETKAFRRPFLRFGRNPEVEVSVLSDPDVSWEHGMIFKHAGQFYYRHLSKVNPTWLNTEIRKALLRPGDQQEIPLGINNQLRIGNTTFDVHVAASPERSKAIPTNKQEYE